MTLRSEPVKRIYRYGWPPAYPYALFAILVALMIAVILGFPGRIGPKIAAASILLPPALLCLRMGRIGAHFTRDGLVLARLFGSKRFSWAEVKAFVIAPRGIQPLAVFVELRTGERVWVEGVGPWMRFAQTSKGLNSVVRRMNHALPTYRRGLLDREHGEGMPSNPGGR